MGMWLVNGDPDIEIKCWMQEKKKKKNLSWLFNSDEKSTHHAKQWPWGGFFCPNLTPMKDSYNIFQESYIYERFLYNKTSPSTGQNGQLS